MAKYPVVIYGASGYTGMLIMDWLIDQNIPFTAVARNVQRTREMMAQRVVRLESATYEIIEAENTVESLVKAFKGAKIVCNTVGPFVKFGLLAVEAALKAGCHHLDTTGEQSYVRNVREQFGELYRQAGLLVAPSVSYMYSFAEIACELALETQGVDALETATLVRGPRGGSAGAGGPTRSGLSGPGGASPGGRGVARSRFPGLFDHGRLSTGCGQHPFQFNQVGGGQRLVAPQALQREV